MVQRIVLLACLVLWAALVPMTGIYSAEPILIGTIKKFSGKVTIVRGKKIVPALTGLKVFEGDQLKTGPKSSAEVFGNKKLIAVGENSDLVLNTEAPSTDAKPTDASGEVISVKLNKGKLRAIVGGAKTDYFKMKIYTRTAVAGVRGTQADIVSEGEGQAARTSVITTEGEQSLDFFTNSGNGEYRKTTVTEGTYIGSSANGTSTGAMSLDQGQWANLRRRDLDNNPMDVRLTSSGEIAPTTTLSEVVGLSSAQLDPAPITMSSGEGRPSFAVPPGSMVYDPAARRFISATDTAGNFVYTNDAAVTSGVVVSPSGVAASVVDVPPTPGDIARANLLLNPEALQTVQETQKLEQQVAQALSGENVNKQRLQELETKIAEQKSKLFELEKAAIDVQIKELTSRVENTNQGQGSNYSAEQLKKDLELAKAEKTQVETKLEIIQAGTSNQSGVTEGAAASGATRGSSAETVAQLEKKLSEATSAVEMKRIEQVEEKLNPYSKSNLARREAAVSLSQGSQPQTGSLSDPTLLTAPEGSGDLTIAVKTADGSVAYMNRTVFESFSDGANGSGLLFPPVFSMEQLKEKTEEILSAQKEQTRQLANTESKNEPANAGETLASNDRMRAYCEANPSSPSCLRSGDVSSEAEKKMEQTLQGLVASGCAANPTLPGCESRAIASQNLLSTTTTASTVQNQCVLNPGAPECQGGANNPCFINPSLAQCGSNGSTTNYTVRPVIINLTR